MKRHEVVAGQKSHRLTLIKELAPVVRNRSRRRVLCVCDCGNEHDIYLDNFVRGNIRSCGCLLTEIRPGIRKIHGFAGTRIFKIWVGMKRRCNSPQCPDYPRYGARGIRVCRSWDKSFLSFLRDMGEAPKGKTLDRKNNDRGYSPSNCRWATPKEQARNRRSSRRIRFKGKNLTVSEWSELTGMSVGLLASRLKRKWSPARIFNTPLMKKYSHKGQRSKKAA